MTTAPINTFGAFHFLTALLDSALTHSSSTLTVVTTPQADAPSGYVGLIDATGHAYVFDLMELVPHLAAGGAALVAVAEHHCAHRPSLGTVATR